MKKNWVWIVPLCLVAGGAAGFFISRLLPKHVESSAAESPPPEEKQSGQITFTPEQIEHAEIKTEPLHAGTLKPDIRLFGVIQEDPADSFALRAGVSAIISTIEGKQWPNFGDMLADRSTIGSLQPRIAPSDQIALATQRTALQTQVTSANADVATAAAALAAAQADYDRLKALNAQDKNVSDKVVEDALAKLKAEQAHHDGAKQTLELATAALASVNDKLTAVPLTVADGGQVVELGGNPGEAVESGQLIVRVARFKHVIAAVSAPPDVDIPADIKTARIVALAGGHAPVEGIAMGSPAAVDQKTQGRILLFRILLDEHDRQLRPGATVTAFVPAEGEALKGVPVPETAVVRYLGKAWVYIADTKDTFTRREITLDHPTPDGTGWFTLSGFKDEEPVVTSGAPILLSFEINKAFGGGE